MKSIYTLITALLLSFSFTSQMFAVGSVSLSTSEDAVVKWMMQSVTNCTVTNTTGAPVVSGGPFGLQAPSDGAKEARLDLASTPAGSYLLSINCTRIDNGAAIADTSTINVVANPALIPGDASVTVTPDTGVISTTYNISWSLSSGGGAPTYYEMQTNTGAWQNLGMMTNLSTTGGGLIISSPGARYGVNTISVRGCNSNGCGSAGSKNMTITYISLNFSLNTILKKILG